MSLVPCRIYTGGQISVIRQRFNTWPTFSLHVALQGAKSPLTALEVASVVTRSGPRM